MNSSPSPDYSILTALQPIANRPRTSFLYTLNLFVVTFAMILLPLIYFALIGLVAYGIYYHADQHVGWLTGTGRRSGRGMLGAAIIYIVPIIVGCVVVFFMIKPIFAGRPKRAQPLALNPSDNPLLFAFIERICEVVGAPSPKRIDLNCELNASAGFRRGFLSMFGNDLVLTLGLPLVANLSAAEFAGVIAHEFGHFTQSVGMRLTYVIRSINFWFMRVVYERDSWDERLEDWATEVEDGRVAIVLWTAQLGVWFARLILRILMYIGWLIGGIMLRQMEYDADAWEIKLAGSETFERTQRKLATLGAAMEKMYGEIHSQWQKTQLLPDNLSELLRQNHESLSPATLQKIEDASGLERTGLFDSHPSLADRIRAARQAQEAGVFHDERPAASLFSSFDHPARFVTLLHYTDDLEIPVTEPMLLRVEPKAATSGTITLSKAPSPTAVARESLVNEYFLGLAPLLLPMNVDSVVVTANYESDMAELLQLTEGLRQVRAQLVPIAEQYTTATRRLIQAQAGGQLLASRVAIDPKAFGLSDLNETAAQSVAGEAAQVRNDLVRSVHEVGAALERRLKLGLRVALSSGDKDEASDIAAALVRNETMATEYPRRLELHQAMLVFEHMSAAQPEGPTSPEWQQALNAQFAIINSLQPAPAMAEPPEKSGLQLRVNKARTIDATNIGTLRRATEHWLLGYRENLGRLVEAAQRAEGIHG